MLLLDQEIPLSSTVLRETARFGLVIWYVTIVSTMDPGLTSKQGVAVPSTFVSTGELDSVRNALQVMYNTQNNKTGAFAESG